MTDMPQFTHDSGCCTFLGRWRGPFHGGDPDVTDFDLYYCQASHAWPTVIARFGDDGPEYTSGLAFVDKMALYDGRIVRMSLPLDEAFRRALERGLVDRERVLASFLHLAPLFKADTPIVIPAETRPS